MKRYLSFLPVLLLMSCLSRDSKKSSLSTRDSLVHQFLQLTDSLPGTDPLHPQRKFLAAYLRNDTPYLRKSVEEVQELLQNQHEVLDYSSCRRPEDLTALHFTEAYRFQYGAAFCDQSINITIGKRHDSVLLISYHYRRDYRTDSCLSVVRTEQSVTASEWTAIRAAMVKTDFWGLKADNRTHGLDGSELTVTGYEKPINAFKGRYSSVWRWAAEKTALGEAFKLVLDLSEVKVPCFHF